VLYGRRIEPTPVLLDHRTTSRQLSQLSPSALVTIELEGESHMALVREKQRNVITGSLLHIDFQVVSMQDKLRSNVYVEFLGESPAVKNFNGILFTELNQIEVECLPSDLPERITVDVSILTNIGDSIYVRDLVIPANVEVLEDANSIVAVVTAPEAEEVEEVAAPTVSVVAEPEVIEKGKKEEEEEE
jgi:large subunit ribosomal protein L25